MVDTTDSKSVALLSVPVQVRPEVPFIQLNLIMNGEPPRAYAHGIKSALSRVQAALAPNLLSPVARYISL